MTYKKTELHRFNVDQICGIFMFETIYRDDV